MSTSPVPPPDGLPFWVAHTPTKTNPEFHSLTSHCLEVARLSRGFAETLGMSEIAYFLGLTHDLGKFKPEFQKYLRDCYLATWYTATIPSFSSHFDLRAKYVYKNERFRGISAVFWFRLVHVM